MKRFRLFAPASAGLVLVLHAAAMAATPAETSLNKCQDAVRNAGKKYVQGLVGAAGSCLKKVAKDVLQSNVAITASTASTCVTQFRKFNDTRVPALDKDFEAKLRAKIEAKCVPGGNNTHSIDDVTGLIIGGTVEDVKTTNTDDWCKHFGGDGSIGTIAEWEDCIVAAQNCAAAAAISAQYPRAAEWLAALSLPMLAVPPPVTDPSKSTDADAGRGIFQGVVDPNGDGVNDPKCGGEAMACGKACCYVETFPGPTAPETTCFEYTGPPAGVVSFMGSCGVFVHISLPTGAVLPGAQVSTAVPGPCFAGPLALIPCAVPGINAIPLPPDSSCP